MARPLAVRPYALALIGCGNMGGALLRGWLATGIVGQASVLEPHGAPDGLVAPHVRFFVDTQSFLAARPAADIVVLAVKPQILTDACAAILPAVPEDALVLSIAAGKTVATVQALFPAGQPVVRAMPNTPAAIGKGITGLVAASTANAAHRQAATELLGAAGETVWLEDERLMDPLTAISASGPAYLFYFVEALSAAATKLGLPEGIASKLARQTIIGSAALLGAQPDTEASQLRRSVTSPNGTTQAALDVLMDGRWLAIVEDAAAAASRRAVELNG